MKILVSVFILMICALAANAQVSDPVEWVFSVKKISVGVYEVRAHASVQSPWHIYSQNTPAGGPVPTQVKFGANPLVTVRGSTVEKGELVKKYEEVFSKEVQYYNREVDFVQRVTVTNGVRTNLSGTVRYMTCNDAQCLPPKNVGFNLDLK